MTEWTHASLTQAFTWWAKASVDGYGAPTFSAPVAVKGRWEHSIARIVDASGATKDARHTVYLDRDVAVGDWLYEGASSATDPRDVSGAVQVQDFLKVRGFDDVAAERVAVA